jgi:hypothetical protein
MARPPLHPACPRCGYDVSGVVPTWAEQCPIHGTCSECGLAFEWVDIFRPERVYPAWSFEHANRRRIRALVGTVYRAMRPGLMWRNMPLSAPVRPGRLVALAVMMLTIAHGAVLAICVQIFEPWLWRSVWSVRGGMTVSSNPSFAWDYLGRIAVWPYSHWWCRLIGPLGVLLLVWGVLAPIPFLVLRQTMAAAKVRQAHLLRGWLYFLVPLSFVVVVDAAMMGLPTLLCQWLGISGFPGWAEALWTGFGWSLFVVAVAAFVRWWWLFTCFYLQLPGPRRVAMTMLAVSLLAALVICLILDEQMRYAIGTPLNSVLGWRAY